MSEHFKVSEKAKRIDYFDDGVALFQACREQKFEGIVAKRALSSYQAGQRSPDWLKIKYSLIETFVIVGHRAEDGYVLALLSQNDRVVGCVNYGFTNAEREDLTERLVVLSESIERKKKMINYEPSILVRIEFMEWTSRRLLRYPVFRGFA